MARTLDKPSPRLNRNVHIYDDNGRILGGMTLRTTRKYITNANFYDMCREFLVFTPPDTQWSLFRLNRDGSTGDILPRDRKCKLKQGPYVVLDSNGRPVNVNVTEENPPRRAITAWPSTARLSQMQRHFRDTSRARDGACTISGDQMAMRDDPFVGLDACHIFPVSRESQWVQDGYMNWITDSNPQRIGVTRMYSAQNGLLLSSSLHHLFARFGVSINPDDGYKVIFFGTDYHNNGGRTLSTTATNPTNNNDRVSDDTLRWHFRMSILKNMKGAALGEENWEYDLGLDAIGEIMEGPDAAERMEVELFNRLGSGVEYEDRDVASDSDADADARTNHP
ncbi:hypothetical protein VTN77DRAFT_525 [Rasamsonia byssochlamydoides]|uniref:uncharacterized protein n=1 Tax=Rasamsonia byssochlamydoides TaxID=89139 RepID=UPI0037427BF3